MNVEQTEFVRPHNLKDFNGQIGTVSYGTDDGLIVEFFIQPKHMEYLSHTLGHPIFQDRVMTRIVAPGNTKTVWVHETKGIKYDTAVDPDSGEYHTTWELLDICENGEPTEPTKYPKAWARFTKKAQPSDLGWPIEEWGVVSRSMAESLKLLGVPTVEALAALSDTNVQSIMGGRKFRDLARAALDEHQKNSIVAAEQSRAERAEEKAQLLETKVTELTDLVTKMQAQYAATMGQHAAASVASVVAPPAAAPALRQASVPRSKRTREIENAA